MQAGLCFKGARCFLAPARTVTTLAHDRVLYAVSFAIFSYALQMN